MGKDIYLGTASVQIKSCWKGTKNRTWGTSLVVQRLGLQASNTGDMSSIPGRGTKEPHVQQRSQKNRTKPEDSSTGLWRVVLISWESGTDGRFFS